MASQIKIGIVPHPTRVSDEFIDEKIRPELEGHGFEIEVVRQSLKQIDPECPVRLAGEDDPQILLVLGGDGTFLGASRLAARAGIPVVGVEVGKLGFLCQSKLESFPDLASSLAKGEYETEERMLLEGEIVRHGEVVAGDIALNDVVVGNATIPRMLDLDCYISDTFLVSYLADALIISTPTGSTAYAMAAGGPLVDPRLNTMILTPICAHSLYIRPLVMPDDEVVRVLPDPSNPPLMVTFDGQVFYNLEKGDEVRVSRYERNLKMIKLADFNFFDTLMKKFKWGFKYPQE